MEFGDLPEARRKEDVRENSGREGKSGLMGRDLVER